MKPQRLLVFVLCMAAKVANADAGCGIVFGSDWAFAFSTPARWVSQCRSEQPAAAALALWPRGTTLADAPAVMSVTVNDKKRRSLPLFAADEQQRVRSGKPTAMVRFEPGMSVGGSTAALVFRVADGQHHQLIAYVEGPTRFFVVAMSARNAESLKEHKGDFQTLLNSFTPMKVVLPPAK